ncbi:MAG: hypothetical protein Q9213_005270 [Squamulea squamosa]
MPKRTTVCDHNAKFSAGQQYIKSITKLFLALQSFRPFFDAIFYDLTAVVLRGVTYTVKVRLARASTPLRRGSIN